MGVYQGNILWTKRPLPKWQLMNTSDRFTEFGKASVLVGLQYAVEMLQAMLNDIRSELNGIQKTQPGRKPKPSKQAMSGQAAYWAKMTPDERQAEVQRRARVALGKHAPQAAKPVRASLTHPQHPDHPGHARWLAANRKAVKKRWAAMSPAARNAQIQKMQDAKRQAAA